MVGITQLGKTLSIDTPLGADKLLLLGIFGSEFIAKPFHFQLEMLSDNHDIQPNDIVGKKVDINITLEDRTQRIINGYITNFIAGPLHRNGHRIYHAQLVPWLQLLTFHHDCRIFQNQDIKAILEAVFQSRGYADFQINTQRSFRQREYTVQYRESDFDFVSRLMEEEGIFYFFTHQKGKHTLIIADASSTYIDCIENKARYFKAGKTNNHLTEWTHEYALISGKWSQTDYHFKTPNTDISTTVDSIVTLPGITAMEQYDYPGLYQSRNDGDGLTKMLIEAQETTYDIVSSSGSYRSFFAGGKFTLTEHEINSENNKEYVITAISHHLRENSYELDASGAFEYHNSFECIPSQVAFRPPRMTCKPFVQGPQTAVVVGPSGEEIYTDEFGRIKVQFHWDRVGEKNENSSCWMRVSQQWAGKQWGAIYLPRIGHEVIVSFLDGDPDQPVVTGCVYNANNMPPYDLPANKTQSGWKTRSSMQGGTANFNELRFEDKKGNEQIYIHAEKNQDNIVENDETTEVGHDRTETIGNNEEITIGNNRTEKVGNDESITIGSNRTENVGKNESITIGNNRTESVGKNETITIADNQSIDIGKNQSENIGKAMALTVGTNRGTDIGKNDLLSVGKKLTIKAGDEISLTTGSASIVMKKNGDIIIKGKNITVKGSGKINIKASSDIMMKGSKISQN